MAAKARRSTRKKTETIRERASKSETVSTKPRRLRRSAKSAARPLRALLHIGRKEYYIPLPNNRLGKFLNKRRRIMPRYFQQSWQELKQVTWPGRKETWKLTVAVFIFAVAFGFLVAVTDYGLDKIFRKVLL